MALKDFFKKLHSVDADEARAYIEREPAESFVLLDVRQPREYERDHIAGAVFVPLPELADRLDELPRDRPVIAYCAVGGRSSMAARFLAARGFDEVYNLTGGIEAWQGRVVTGPVGLHLPFIEEYDTFEKMLGLAYRMEHSLAAFYRGLSGRVGSTELDQLLERLAVWEEGHRAKLVDEAVRRGIAETALRDSASGPVMEGGFEPQAFQENHEAYLRSRNGVLEVAMMIETHALDLYLRMAHAVEGADTANVLLSIADDEKRHLRALGEIRGG